MCRVPTLKAQSRNHHIVEALDAYQASIFIVVETKVVALKVGMVSHSLEGNATATKDQKTSLANHRYESCIIMR